MICDKEKANDLIKGRYARIFWQKSIYIFEKENKKITKIY